MALFCMLSDWCTSCGLNLLAVSVDHGLRREATSECALVRKLADSLGHRHATLKCDDIGSRGNLQKRARDKRYTMIAKWAKRENISEVALGHTLNDQAETLLLNLSRGSGIDGLSAMPARICRHGTVWIRPLLSVERGDLRAYLKHRRLAWAEDPGNEDTRFDRVKARRLLDALAPLGINAERLAETSFRMQTARNALEFATAQAARELATISEVGEVCFAGRFWDMQEEIRLRLAAHALKFLSGAEYRPRLSALATSLDASREGKSATLSGCIATGLSDGRLLFSREPAACPPCVPPDEVWDGRWKLEGSPAPAGAMIGALTEAGLRECPDWKRACHSRLGLICSPALWCGDELLSAPLAGLGREWQARLLSEKDDFVKSLQSV